MTDEPYEVNLTRTARRALAEQLPIEVVMAVSDFLNGPIAGNPHRIGKELDAPFHGVHSARVMREWRVLYVIDDEKRAVTIRDIRHRRDAYKPR